MDVTFHLTHSVSKDQKWSLYTYHSLTSFFMLLQQQTAASFKCISSDLLVPTL